MPSTTRDSARHGRSLSVRHIAHRVADNVWGDSGARIGLAARGVVYLTLAYLVARVALGALGHASTSRTASVPGVAQAIADETGGRIALLLLGVALIPYALFGAIDAVLHHDTETPKIKRWGDRMLSLWSIVFYGGFSLYCFVVAAEPRARTQSASQSDRQDSQWSADVLRWPAGWAWLGGLGVVLFLIAAFLLWRGARARFRSWLRCEEMSQAMWRCAIGLGAIGYFGRAALFALVGWFVLAAAIEDDPRQGQGVDGSIRLFADSTAGPYLLWLVALGLAGYGLYAFVEARYRSV
jgi:Domain of Unknown Function (DUF1206)